MPPQLSTRILDPASPRSGASAGPVAPTTFVARAEAGVAAVSPGATSLHVSKLRGISIAMRRKLKRQGITYTHQLLQSAGGLEARRHLAERAEIDEADLTRLVCRADLARIKGVGAIFADMLELIGVDRVALLAEQSPAELHGVLYDLNSAERFARRAPTPEEVEDWVRQARQLPRFVDDDG